MGTHINAYKTEATQALQAVREAVLEAETKIAGLLAELEKKDETTETTEPVIPAEAPAASPIVDDTTKAQAGSPGDPALSAEAPAQAVAQPKPSTPVVPDAAEVSKDSTKTPNK